MQIEWKHKKEAWEDNTLVLDRSQISKSTISISGILISNQNIKFKTILKGNRKQWESLLLLFKTIIDAILKGIS